MKNKSPWSGITSQLKNNQATKNSPAKIVTRWKLQLIPPVKGQRPEPLSHKLQFIIPTTGCQLQENCPPVQSLWEKSRRDLLRLALKHKKRRRGGNDVTIMMALSIYFSKYM